MRDVRITKLAELLVNHSCSLTTGEKVLIESINAPNEIVISLIRAAKAAGASPVVIQKDDQLIRELARTCTVDDVKLMARCELAMLKEMDAFISIRGVPNAHEYADVPPDKRSLLLENYIEPVHLQYRNANLKWVALRWPTSAFAQRAGMSTEAFEDFFFEASTLDYAKLEQAMTPLAELLDETDIVRIVGPGDTNLKFSIKGISQYKSAGYHNVPDGELFTAPIKDSIEGRICYNVRSTFYGHTFENICFDFHQGRVVNAVCSQNIDALNKLLEQDDGAAYVGEFAFGVHPLITRPIDDILFDEKMTGTIHLAQGNSYPMCDNGNRSAIHWDLILDQREKMGGGSVFFDDALVRQAGVFVLPQLAALNPQK